MILQQVVMQIRMVIFTIPLYSTSNSSRNN